MPTRFLMWIRSSSTEDTVEPAGAHERAGIGPLPDAVRRRVERRTRREMLTVTYSRYKTNSTTPSSRPIVPSPAARRVTQT